eukprot:COSAG06_NODE_1561_length_9104_cov_25.044309_13_plen_150_part_00
MVRAVAWRPPRVQPRGQRQGAFLPTAPVDLLLGASIIRSTEYALLISKWAPSAAVPLEIDCGGGTPRALAPASGRGASLSVDLPRPPLTSRARTTVRHLVVLLLSLPQAEIFPPSPGRGGDRSRTSRDTLRMLLRLLAVATLAIGVHGT